MAGHRSQADRIAAYSAWLCRDCTPRAVGCDSINAVAEGFRGRIMAINQRVSTTDIAWRPAHVDLRPV